MIKIKEKLTILHDDNSSFADYTRELAGFDRDTASLTFIALEDSIYIGFYKPVNTFYIQFSTANTNDIDLAVKYYNGSAFTAVAGLHDDTDGFQRNGFVRWDRNQTDEAKTTVNSSEKYWYKLDLSGDSSAMVIIGLNIVFSDDQDLKREYYEILNTNFFPSGVTSHILTHEAARDEIIQELNIRGREKVDSTTYRLEDITAFDLLDVSEVKLASTYLVLSKIFFALSDQVDDLYSVKSLHYRSLYSQVINGIDLKTDIDDDGIYDNGEREKINFGVITRL